MTTFGSDLILARLQSLHPKRIDLSLGRIERLLARLGHPERRLPPVVHIAGTNGKGSTLAMLSAMLEAEGRRVHRYISPHLVHFNERILLSSVPIEESRLAAVLDAAERANAGAAHHLLRDHHGRGVPGLRRRAGRHPAARDRARRPAGRDEPRRPAAAHADLADLDGPRELPRRHDRGHRRREGRHPQARRAGADRPAAPGGGGGARAPGPGDRGAAGPQRHRMAGYGGRGPHRAARRRRSGWTCPSRPCPASIRSRMPGSRRLPRDAWASCRRPPLRSPAASGRPAGRLGCSG